MLFILLISSSVLVWNIDAQSSQNPFGFGNLFGNFDFDGLLFGNLQNGGGNDFPEGGNVLSRAYPRNTQQSGINNGYSDNNRAPSNQQRVQSAHVQYSGKVQSQQSTYHANNIQQSQIHQQTTQAQHQSYPQNSQNQQSNYQQNEHNSVYGPNAQSQLQTNEQKTQSQQQLYQQNAQSQQQFYQQDAQSPQNLYQQNVQAQQKLYKQNLQAQQQLHQQNTQPQQQFYQQNAKPQQQSYQQNAQPQQQLYQQNVQTQQQLYQQSIQPQQQPYKQNQQSQIVFGTANGANYFSKNRNDPTTSDIVLSSKFNDDVTRTGKPKQNASYNNETFAITKFGLKMFKTMSRDFSNVVASPYSVAMLLALVQQGAHGDSQQEITQLLQLTPESSGHLFKKLTDTMRKRNSRNVFKVANNVVMSNEFNIESKFKSTALNSFGSDVTRMNFNDPYGATKMINEWVSRKTNQKITNLLEPEAVSQETLAMLVNAVYFKGVWEKKFDPKMTTDKEFTLSDGTKKLVPFMEARRMFQTDIDPVLKAQILILPFEGTQYSMMFILPFKGVYAVDVLSSLTEPQLYSYQKLTAKEVKVEIPRFTVKKESDAYFILNLLGLWKVFGNEADLTGIGSHEGASPHITSGVHSALLSIDEQGGSAAAATTFSVVALSYDDPTTSFIANRPFLAILWDNELSMPLFMAKVEDPQA